MVRKQFLHFLGGTKSNIRLANKNQPLLWLKLVSDTIRPCQLFSCQVENPI